MKKTLYITMCVVTVLVACAKENEEVNNPLTTSQEPKSDVEYVEFSITANLPLDQDENNDSGDTKTSYDFDTDPSKALFTWTDGDQITLVVNNNGIVSNQSRWNLDMATLSDDKKTATFSALIDKHKATSGWISTGFAVYPTSISQINEASGYSYPYVKLQSSVTGTKASVIMVGTPDNADNPTNFIFKTATAVLRVTVNDIPANAKELRLTTSDKGNYPIDGHFSLINNDGTVTIGRSQYLGSGSGCQKVDLSKEGAIDSREFLFNIPVGEYPANTLMLQLIDSNDMVILEKKVAKNFNFIRNHFISTPSLGMDWELLGNAKFVDNYTFAKVDSKAGYMVDVPVYKNSDNKTYRLKDPYDAAWKAFDKTNSGSDAIVTLEVKKSGDKMISGANNLTVTHDDLVYFYRGTDPTQSDNRLFTGYKLVNAGSIIVSHPYAKASSTAESYMLNSKVKKYQNNGIPAVITLAPSWDGRNSDHIWLDDVTNVIYIIFPGCNPAEAIAGTYNVRENANYQLTIETNDTPGANCKITRYKGGDYDVSGTFLGNFDNGVISFPAGQLFAEKGDGQYYFFFMATSATWNALSLKVDNDVSQKAKTGRRLQFTEAGFGLGYGTLVGEELTNLQLSGQQWTSPGDQTMMIKNE